VKNYFYPQLFPDSRIPLRLPSSFHDRHDHEDIITEIDFNSQGLPESFGDPNKKIFDPTDRGLNPPEGYEFSVSEDVSLRAIGRATIDNQRCKKALTASANCSGWS
jgi:hypothetical protein